MLNCMVKTCSKEFWSYILTQIWECWLFPRFEYHIYNTPNSLPLFFYNFKHRLWWTFSKYSLFWTLKQGKKKHLNRKKNTSGLQKLLNADLETTLVLNKTDLKSKVFSHTRFLHKKKAYVFEKITRPLFDSMTCFFNERWQNEKFLALMKQGVWEVVYTFFKNFDRNVKLYESTEKFPKRAMYYLLTLGGQATANLYRCTLQLISI